MDSPRRGPRASILDSVKQVEKLPMFQVANGVSSGAGATGALATAQRRQGLTLKVAKARGPAAAQSGDPNRSKLFGIWQAASTDVETAHLAMSGIAPDSVHSAKTIAGGTVASGAAGAKDKLDATKRLKHGVELSFSQAGHRQSWQAQMQDGVRYTEYFKKCCKRKHFNMTRAWRVLLDPGGNGRVSFVPFCNAARAMGFANVQVLWKHLDFDNSGFITLDCWDPDAFRNLMEFRHICMSEYGGLQEAFRFGIDNNGSGTIAKDELQVFLDNYEFSGDLDVLWGALDENNGGFITADELDFLGRWEGERFRPARVAREYDLGFRRLQMTRRKQRTADQKVIADRLRGEAEKKSIEENRSERRKVLRQSEFLQGDDHLQALESYKAPTMASLKEESDDEDVTQEKRAKKRQSILNMRQSILAFEQQLEARPGSRAITESPRPTSSASSAASAWPQSP